MTERICNICKYGDSEHSPDGRDGITTVSVHGDYIVVFETWTITADLKGRLTSKGLCLNHPASATSPIVLVLKQCVLFTV